MTEHAAKLLADASTATLAAEAAQDATENMSLPETIQTTGGKLRAQRESLGLTPEDIGSALKVPARKIKAIEAEQWEALPTGPYLRGFLRSYAKILRIDAQELIDEIGSSLTQSRSPDTILRLPNSFNTPLPRQSVASSDGRGGRLLIYGAGVVVVLILLMLWSGTASFNDLLGKFGLGSTVAVSSTPPVTQPATLPETPAPATVDVAVPAATNDAPANAAAMMQAANSDAAAATAANAATAASTTAPTTSNSPTKAPAGMAVAAPASGTSTLQMDFQAESWVQVKQTDGQILMSKTNFGNAHEILNGVAPLDLIIGNASVVKLQFRGEPVDLTPYIHENVARLTLK
jgi:cytoskeleton protein RodZ